MIKTYKEFLNESKSNDLEIRDGLLIKCNNKSLMSITIPDSVTSIGNDAFYDCTKLASITMPDSVTSIGNGAFQRCTRLASVTIPDSVKSIGNCAFDGCTSLASITIPDSCTSIGNDAFDKCPLKDLDLVTALFITKLSNRDVIDCVKKDIKLSGLEQQRVMKLARIHNAFDLVKPYIDDDLWHANRGSRGIANLED